MGSKMMEMKKAMKLWIIFCYPFISSEIYEKRNTTCWTLLRSRAIPFANVLVQQLLLVTAQSRRALVPIHLLERYAWEAFT